MLIELFIRNLALIDQAHILFGPGLNVLSGETGAGKSILVGAIGLVLGAKANPDFIRFGSNQGEVTGVFNFKGNIEVSRWLEDRDLPLDDETLTIRRVLRREGRSSSYIQSVPTSIPDLEELTALLVDMHGQHAHQSLFKVSVHRALLDRYLGLETRSNQFNQSFQELTKLGKDILEFEQQNQENKDQESHLKKKIIEIEKAKLLEGEEESLVAKEKKLSQFDSFQGILNELHQLLSSSSGIVNQLDQGKRKLQDLVEIDDAFENLLERVSDAWIDLEDLAGDIRTKRLETDFDPQDLLNIRERLNLIYSLEKKYGADIPTVLSGLADSKVQLEKIENGDDYLEKMKQKKSQDEQALRKEAQEISALRKEGKIGLEQSLMDILSALGMSGLKFSVSMTQKTGSSGGALIGPFGMDYIEFVFSPNPGQPLRPLKDIASGGELSRVMLALKSVLSNADNIDVLIFDEIDTGIGGEVGVSLGRYLQKLGQKKQVLCITHLASVASFSNTHFLVEKGTEINDTFTKVVLLEEEERISELSRMLSGDSAAQQSIDHARELLQANSPQGE